MSLVSYYAMFHALYSECDFRHLKNLGRGVSILSEEALRHHLIGAAIGALALCIILASRNKYLSTLGNLLMAGLIYGMYATVSPVMFDHCVQAYGAEYVF